MIKQNLVKRELGRISLGSMSETLSDNAMKFIVGGSGPADNECYCSGICYYWGNYGKKIFSGVRCDQVMNGALQFESCTIYVRQC